MAEATQPISASQPVPDPEALKPAGLSNAHKRYIYYGITAALAVLILANVVGSKQTPAPMQVKQNTPAKEANPSPAQIRDWENNLKQAEAQLAQEQKDREQQLAMARAAQQSEPFTPQQQLERAEALQNAELARQQYQQNYGANPNGQPSQKSQLETAQEQQAYKSLFADNMVRQESAASAAALQRPVAMETHVAEPHRSQRRRRRRKRPGASPSTSILQRSRPSGCPKAL